MPSPESGLWNWLRVKFIERGIFHQRIETTTGIGVPDLFVAFVETRGNADEDERLAAAGIAHLTTPTQVRHQVWIEMKALHTRRVKIRPAQRVWHMKAHEHGARILVLNRDPSTQVISIWNEHYELRNPDENAKDPSPLITSAPVWEGTQKDFAAGMVKVLAGALRA